jgi:hypothetical protein
LVSNLSFGSSGSSSSSTKAHLPHVSTLSRPGTRPGIRPVIRDSHLEEWLSVSVSCCLSATGVRFLGILARQRVRPALRSAYQGNESVLWTLAGFPRSTHARYDRVRVPPLRRGQRCSHDRLALPGRRLPLLCGQALYPGPASISRGVIVTTHSTRVHLCSPIRRFPSPAIPGWHRNRSGFSPGLRTPPPRGRRRTPGWGQALSTCPGLHLRHQPYLQPVNPLALSSFVSHMQINPDKLFTHLSAGEE